MAKTAEKEVTPAQMQKMGRILHKLQADEELSKEERKILRSLGAMPPAELLDTLTLGLTRDFEMLFDCTGFHNRVAGGTNIAAKGTLAGIAAKLGYDYLK